MHVELRRRLCGVDTLTSTPCGAQAIAEVAAR
jgi:hypothetical protein